MFPQGIWGQLEFSIIDDGTGTTNYFDIVTNSFNNGGDLRLKQTLVKSGRDLYTVRKSFAGYLKARGLFNIS